MGQVILHVYSLVLKFQALGLRQLQRLYNDDLLGMPISRLRQQDRKRGQVRGHRQIQGARGYSHRAVLPEVPLPRLL